MDMGGGKLVLKIRPFCSLVGRVADARMEYSGVPWPHPEHHVKPGRQWKRKQQAAKAVERERFEPNKRLLLCARVQGHLGLRLQP